MFTVYVRKPDGESPDSDEMMIEKYSNVKDVMRTPNEEVKFFRDGRFISVTGGDIVRVTDEDVQSQ
jgi:hypothetical protein